MPPGSATTTDQQTVEVKTANVSLAKGAHKGLVVLGSLLVILVIACGIYNRAEGSETKEVTTPALNKGEAEEKTTETKAVFSDTLLTTILGAGAALILVGVLYARISSIKLPGGTEVGFITEKDVKEATDAIAKKAAETGTEDPKKIAAATAETFAIVNRSKASATTELPPETYERAAAQGFELAG